MGEALDIALKTNNKNELLNNYRLQIELDSTRGFYQNAFNWQRKYFNLKEEINNLNKPKIPEDIAMPNSQIALTSLANDTVVNKRSDNFGVNKNLKLLLTCWEQPY